MAKVITIDYSPREWAKKFHNSTARWKVIVAHRRIGKTVAIVNHLQRSALTVPESKYAYIGPTYKQAKNIAWDYLKYYSRPIPGVKINESELRVDYPNKSRISLYGSENVDALRGMGLWGGAQDESSQQPSNLFSEIISPCLADHLGYWIYAGTPKGKNEFHKTHQIALANPDRYFDLLWTIEDSLKYESEETTKNLRIALEEAKRAVVDGQMTEDELQQEWYCSFESAIKGAYYAKEISDARIDGRIGIVPYDPVLKVHTVWDLGKGQKMTIGFYQKVGREVHKIDCWQGSDTDAIPQGIKALQQKAYIYGKHFAPHDIRAIELATGKTRIETAKTLGINFEVVPDIGIDNGINAGKLMFSRLWVDEIKCSLWLDAISQYQQEWDESRGCFKGFPYHNWASHWADEYRYASIIEDKMTNEQEESDIETRVMVDENRQDALTNEFFN